MMNPKVIFIPVQNADAKRQALVVVSQRLFSTKTRLLFSVANDEVARYVDELLWKFPPESFLPHAIAQNSSSESIAITTLLKNVNQASVLFNLRPEANPLASQFAVTYELLDSSHPDKLAQSQQRKDAYLKQDLLCSFVN